MRLGFAVAIHVDPDVLLIDEVLAVGDEAFTRKCLDKIGEFRRRGKTIVLVTHSLGLVEKMCDDVLWLRHGADGGPGRSQARGRRLPDLRRGRRGGAARARARPGAAEPTPPPPPRRPAREPPRSGYREGRWGSREVEITRGAPARRPRPASATSTCPASALTVALAVRAAQPVEDFVFGIGLFTADGVSRLRHQHAPRGVRRRARLDGDAEVRSRLDDLRLVEGTYLLDVAAHRRDGTPYDYHRGLLLVPGQEPRSRTSASTAPPTAGPSRAASELAAARAARPSSTSTTTSLSPRVSSRTSTPDLRAPAARAPTRWRRAGSGRGVHQRLLRPAAPRPRGAARGGARARATCWSSAINSDASVRATQGRRPPARARRPSARRCCSRWRPSTAS